MQRIFNQKREWRRRNFSRNIFSCFIKVSFPSTSEMLKFLSALLHMTSFSRVVNICTESFLRLSNFAFLKNFNSALKSWWKHLNVITTEKKLHNQLDFLFFLSHKLRNLPKSSKEKLQNCLKFFPFFSYAETKIKLFMCKKLRKIEEKFSKSTKDVQENFIKLFCTKVLGHVSMLANRNSLLRISFENFSKAHEEFKSLQRFHIFWISFFNFSIKFDRICE